MHVWQIGFRLANKYSTGVENCRFVSKCQWIGLVRAHLLTRIYTFMEDWTTNQQNYLVQICHLSFQVVNLLIMCSVKLPVRSCYLRK